MKDAHRFIVITLITLTLFLKPWALVASVSIYFIWKNMRTNGGSEAEIKEDYASEEPNTTQEAAESRSESVDEASGRHNTAKEAEILSQEEIDELLQPE